MEGVDGFEVEVAYARPDVQVIIPLRVPPGCSVEDAIRRSRVLEKFPEVDLGAQRVGIFGRLVELKHRLRAGDRVEIYRPLVADPKEARKKRARQRGTQNA
jgi:putative ubiquitin-RnfH superfamily antitoxin RatB of RatAB toxin-antitoxin module